MSKRKKTGEKEPFTEIEDRATPKKMPKFIYYAEPMFI
jgi:hypothetical protein